MDDQLTMCKILQKILNFRSELAYLCIEAYRVCNTESRSWKYNPLPNTKRLGLNEIVVTSDVPV